MQFELTSAQKGFYNKNYDVDNSLWNIGLIVLFDKVFDAKKLNDSMNSLAETFEVLRMELVEEGTKVFTRIYDFHRIDYPLFHFSTEKELMDFAQKYVDKAIALDGCLYKALAFQLPDKSGVLLCAHHIIMDGFSAYVLSDYVERFLNGKEVFQSIPYENHVQKELEHKNTKRFLSDRKFWNNQFQSNIVCNYISEGKSTLDFKSAEINCEIPVELFCKIKAFCAANKFSVQNYFNTVYAAYMSRKYEIQHFTIGVPVLNRTTVSEFQSAGLYMHIVPLVVNLSADSFLENALRIEDSQMNLFRHQKFTQYDIKSMLKEQGTPINSLFDIVCDYQEFEKNEDYEIKFVYSNSLSVPIEIHLQSFGEEKHNLKIRYRTAM